MKEFMMLMGFGCGLVTGAMLYKYSQDAKKALDKGEQVVLEKAEQMGEKAEKSIQKINKKIKAENQKMKDKK